MKSSVNVEWQENMHFVSLVNGLPVHLDADESSGGQNLGPRPKPLLLSAIGGCTGMDIVSILKKMAVDIAYFNVKVEADSLDEHPKKFTEMHLIYEIKAANLTKEKLERAITLSMDKYCSVKATLEAGVHISYEYKILD